MTSFKTIKNPTTQTILTASNCRYVAGWGKGNDTGDGSINNPYATLTRAYQDNVSNYVIRGVIEGDIITMVSNSYLIGEVGAEFIGTVNNTVSLGATFIGIKFNQLNVRSANLYNCSIDRFAMAGNSTAGRVLNCIVNTLASAVLGDGNLLIFRNLTIHNFLNTTNNANYNTIEDSIFIDSIDLYNRSSIWNAPVVFKNSIVFKNCQYKWNGVIIPISWTTGNEIDDIKNSLISYANNILTNQSQQNYLIACAGTLFGTGTIIYDDAQGVKVFNSYDSLGIPVDYTLNMQNGNPALFTSTRKDYVGALRPTFPVQWDWDTLVDIDTDGNPTTEIPTLLVSNNGIFANVESDQLRNRVTGNMIVFPNGDGFSRITADIISAADKGWYLGLWQPNPIDGSNIPTESIECEIYDTADQLSAYPKISIPFNEDCAIYYHLQGARIGLPVLFNDLENLGIETNKNLTEVGVMAVTNAHNENIYLENNAAVEQRKLRFKYIIPILTLNRTQDE